MPLPLRPSPDDGPGVGFELLMRRGGVCVSATPTLPCVEGRQRQLEWLKGERTAGKGWHIRSGCAALSVNHLPLLVLPGGVATVRAAVCVPGPETQGKL